MKGTSKDHKVADDPQKGPKMRPIMGARVGPNTGLSQIGSKILRSIIDDVKVRHDVKSTEEMLAKIEQYNESLKSKKSKKVNWLLMKENWPTVAQNDQKAAKKGKFQMLQKRLKYFLK